MHLQVIPDDRPLYDRTTELAAFAESGSNVVLYSPRRYGKTSLVRRVQRDLAARGVVTVFVDFFGVSSIGEVAARLANGLFCSECSTTDSGRSSSRRSPIRCRR